MTKTTVLFGGDSRRLLPDRVVKTDSTGRLASTGVKDIRVTYIDNLTSPAQPTIDGKMNKLIDGLTIRTVNRRSLQGSGPFNVAASSALPAGVEIQAQALAPPVSDWVESTGTKVNTVDFPDLASKYLTPSTTISASAVLTTSWSASVYHLFCSPSGVFVAIAKDQETLEVNEVWSSQDNGSTWTKRVDPLPLPPGFTGWSYGMYFFSRLLMVTTNGDVMVSEDDGASWFQATQTPKSLLGVSYAMNQVGNRLIAVQELPIASGPANSGSYLHYSVAQSFDGLSWTRDTRPYFGLSHYQPLGPNSLGAESFSNAYGVFGSDRRVFVVGKTDGGSFWIADSTDRVRWRHRDLGSLGWLSPSSAISHFGYKDGVYFLGLQSPFQIFQSSDEGATWSISLNGAGSALKHVHSNGEHLLLSPASTYLLSPSGWESIPSVPSYGSLRCWAYSKVTQSFLTTDRNESGGAGFFQTTVSRCSKSLSYPTTFHLPDRTSMNINRDYVMYVKITDPT